MNRILVYVVMRKTIIAALIFLLLITVLIWAGYTENYFPDWTSIREQSRDYNLDQDNYREQYVLRHRHLTIIEKGKEIWSSPPGWQVGQLLLADANNDGRDDLVLTLWKKGSFGRDKPFWMKGEDQRRTNHLFVFDLVNDQLKPVWMSSALEPPIQSLEIKDMNHDGKNELVVDERDTFWRRIFYKQEQMSLWRWDDWGFSRL